MVSNNFICLDKIGGKYVHHCNVRYENKNSNLTENAIITAQVVILFLVNTICNWKFSIGAIHVLLSIRQPLNKYLRDPNSKELIP